MGIAAEEYAGVRTGGFPLSNNYFREDSRFCGFVISARKVDLNTRGREDLEGKNKIKRCVFP